MVLQALASLTNVHNRDNASSKPVGAYGLRGSREETRHNHLYSIAPYSAPPWILLLHITILLRSREIYAALVGDNPLKKTGEALVSL